MQVLDLGVTRMMIHRLIAVFPYMCEPHKPLERSDTATRRSGNNRFKHMHRRSRASKIAPGYVVASSPPRFQWACVGVLPFSLVRGTVILTVRAFCHILLPLCWLLRTSNFVLLRYFVPAKEKQATFTGREQRNAVADFPFAAVKLFGPELAALEASAGGDTDDDGVLTGADGAAAGAAAEVEDADGYQADGEEDVGRVRKGYRFDWLRYRAQWNDTPIHVAVTAMFAEYAELYAMISGQTTTVLRPDMTLSEGTSIGNKATEFVRDYLTPILGKMLSTKVHKLLCHVTDAIKAHGNIQNGNTAANESSHKDDKPYYTRTNKIIDTFTRQLVRHAHGARAVLKQNAVDDDECRAAHTKRLEDERTRAAASRLVTTETVTVGHTATAGGGSAAATARSWGAGSAAAGVTAEGSGGGAGKTPYHRSNMRVGDLAKQPGLRNVGAILGLTDDDKVRVTKRIDITARFECGGVRKQRIHATENDRGSPWYDHVFFHPTGHPSGRRLGQVRAIVRREDGDHAIVCMLRPLPKDPQCPLQARGCTHLQWHVQEGASEVSLCSVPLSAVRRLAQVVPDFGDLATRRGYDAEPAGLGAPLEERMAMRFHLNAFYPWDV